MSYNGTEIVELLAMNEPWSKTTLADAYFVCKAMGYDEVKHIRRLEGSIDGGKTWKIRYMCELERLKEGAYAFQWRVKENS